MKTTSAALTTVVSAAAALVLTACGTGCPADCPANGAAAPAPAPALAARSYDISAAPHNRADITFAQDMIPHHQQAVEMAPLVTGRSSSDGVRALAAAVRDAQEPEIRDMRAMRGAWCAPDPGTAGAPGTGGAENHGSDGMAGMMSPEQMHGLEQSSGRSFDRAFLTMMIAHHEGGVAMARDELAAGANPEAMALAQSIVDSQQREISEMRKMLG